MQVFCKKIPKKVVENTKKVLAGKKSLLYNYRAVTVTVEYGRKRRCIGRLEIARIDRRKED
jgi:hypothetical protein